MNLTQHILTNNDCYKANRTIAVKGLMLHSTGANNPNLSRYVPAWDVPKPEGRDVCVHGFIGKTADGSVATYQTLPWNHRAWHCGGSGNDTHIAVEICEDSLTDPTYFAAVYKEAVELFAFLCSTYGLNEHHIICHSEGHTLGIASNHADVMHWFPKHGKSMDTFRADVKAHLGGAVVQPVSVSKPAPVAPPVAPASHQQSVNIDQLAHDVIAGKYGGGDARKAALGANYAAVQARVNEILGAKSQPAPAPQPSVDELAQKVIAGAFGSGDARRAALGAQYDAVQARVNQILGGGSKPAPAPSKSIHDLALEVIKGLHGSGDKRKAALGSNYAAVQAEVNRILSGR
jgi:N-acetylmuramoyl-L-alanine amidase